MCGSLVRIVVDKVNGCGVNTWSLISGLGIDIGSKFEYGVYLASVQWALHSLSYYIAATSRSWTFSTIFISVKDSLSCTSISHTSSRCDAQTQGHLFTFLFILVCEDMNGIEWASIMSSHVISCHIKPWYKKCWKFLRCNLQIATWFTCFSRNQVVQLNWN
jgi:hypothetical protein